MKLNKEAVARVRRGAALLDEYGPVGWRDRVNLDKLNMTWGHRCVLGQVYAEPGSLYSAYLRGLDQLGIEHEDRGSHRGPAYYGFDESSRASYPALERAWTDYLTRTRQEDAR